MQFQVQIYITLRPSILDSAGTAVQASLQQLGYAKVDHLRIGKYIQLQLEAIDATHAQDQVDQMCQQLLVNPVIENYRVEMNPVAVASGY